jgi:hypothetical protein
MNLELGSGKAPTLGYVHHDRRRHSPRIDEIHDLELLPWPWPWECDGPAPALLGGCGS